LAEKNQLSSDNVLASLAGQEQQEAKRESQDAQKPAAGDTK